MLVLLADDDPDQLAIREMLLAQFGFRALIATTVEAALAAVSHRSPDCALVDLRLPDEAGGLRLIRELKRKHPQIRISVFTGASVKCLDKLPERALVERVFEKGKSSFTTVVQHLRAKDLPH